jgi:hypothetical protein
MRLCVQTPVLQKKKKKKQARKKEEKEKLTQEKIGLYLIFRY